MEDVHITECVFHFLKDHLKVAHQRVFEGVVSLSYDFHCYCLTMVSEYFVFQIKKSSLTI